VLLIHCRLLCEAQSLGLLVFFSPLAILPKGKPITKCWIAPAQVHAEAARLRGPWAYKGATSRRAEGDSDRELLALLRTRSDWSAPAMLARSAIVAGKKPKPAAPAAAAGGGGRARAAHARRAAARRGDRRPMAATNKCLAQSNKSRHVSRATKDTNGHRPSEQPTGHARSGLRRAHGAPSVHLRTVTEGSEGMNTMKTVMRKTTLMVAAAVVGWSLIPAAANAHLQMPRDLTGTWCHSHDFEQTALYLELEPNMPEKCEDWIKFEPYVFRSVDSECIATKIAVVGRDRQFVTPVYDIAFRCARIDQTDRWRARGHMFIAKGKLWVEWKK
jgi:hypothetical protein